MWVFRISSLYIYFLLVKDGKIICGSNFACAQEQILGDAGRDVQFLRLVSHLERIFCYFGCLFISLPGRINLLWDAQSVHRHGSSLVPTPKVQALSATVDGMEPSSMPLRRISSLMPMMYCLVWGRLVAMLAIVLVLLNSCCLLVWHAHCWAILLAVAGGIVGQMSMWLLNSTFFLT